MGLLTTCQTFSEGSLSSNLSNTAVNRIHGEAGTYERVFVSAFVVGLCRSPPPLPSPSLPPPPPETFLSDSFYETPALVMERESSKKIMCVCVRWGVGGVGGGYE